MTSKYIAWGLGIVLVLILGIVAFFWKSQDKKVLAPEIPPQATNTVKEESSVQTTTIVDESSIMKTAPTTDTSNR